MRSGHFLISCLCLAVCCVSRPAEAAPPPGTQCYFQFPPSSFLPLPPASVQPSSHTYHVQHATFEEPRADAIDDSEVHALASENLSVSSELPESTARSLEGDFSDAERVTDVGPNLYAPGDFTKGLVIHGKNAALKIGGYVKADLIYDFNAIDSTDTFDTTSIPVGAPQRTNTRFHARQSRLNFDTRWGTDWGPARGFAEADFFSDGDRWRLRHAYGEIRQLIVGQTWTTLTHMAAIPQTLDFEGAVSSISRRQAQVRWTQEVFCDGLDASLAIENPRVLIESAGTLPGSPRTPTPDLIGRFRLSRDWGQFQCAGVVRQLGYQDVVGPVETENAWGINFTGAVEATDQDKVYYQILFGTGIGSYKGLPDITVAAPDHYEILDTFGWMIGWTHDWTEQWSSNFTYSVNRLQNAPFQAGSELHENSYMALNLIWNPIERFYLGGEYLFGTRENVDGARDEANRLQVSFIFELP
jgi:DcaP outer membrane protein